MVTVPFEEHTETGAELVVRTVMRGILRGVLGEPSCVICADAAKGLYRWQNDPDDMPPGPLCADCAEIQQKMYGDPTHDALIRVSDCRHE